MSEKANLARIRDNQRRSRARRKEYLQELEARVRQCELQGIEASAEIQQAARRVADENKKLRSLLLQHGVRDDSIEAYFRAHEAGETLVGNQVAGTISVPVQVLEQLLQIRKPCCSESRNGTSCDSKMGESRGSSTSASTIQSIWDNTSVTPHPSSSNLGHHYMTPSRTASSVGSIGQRSSQCVSRHQNSYHISFAQDQDSNSNLLDFDPQSFQRSQSINDSAHSIEDSQYAPAPPSVNTNVKSCDFATDMITTMSGLSDPDPYVVRAELGCLPDMNCEVDNQLIFDVMDRYTGSNVDL